MRWNRLSVETRCGKKVVRGLHEEDGDDKVVSVALQPEAFYERVSRLVRVEGTRIPEICSVEIVKQIACFVLA
jgi:hypothetical protein